MSTKSPSKPKMVGIYPAFANSVDDQMGVVGCGEGVVYLTSRGRPTDIGLQLGKAYYPCSW